MKDKEIKYEMIEVENIKNTCFGFNQDDLYNFDLTVNDAYVLRWFVDFTTNPKMEKLIVGDEIYYWVNYKTVIEQLPLLRIKERKSIQRIFNRLVECKVLKQHITHSKLNLITKKKTGGKFTYFAFDERCFLLTVAKPKKEIKVIIDKEEDSNGQKSPKVGNGQKSPKGNGQKSPKGKGQICPVKDTSIIDTSIIDTSININKHNETNCVSDLFKLIVSKSSSSDVEYEEKDNDNLGNSEDAYAIWLQELITAQGLEGYLTLNSAQAHSLISEMVLRGYTVDDLNEMKRITDNKGIYNPRQYINYITAIIKNGYTKQKNKELKTANFEQRNYDYDDLEKRLLGWK